LSWPTRDQSGLIPPITIDYVSLNTLQAKLAQSVGGCTVIRLSQFVPSGCASLATIRSLISLQSM